MTVLSQDLESVVSALSQDLGSVVTVVSQDLGSEVIIDRQYFLYLSQGGGPGVGGVRRRWRSRRRLRSGKNPPQLMGNRNVSHNSSH